MYEDLICEKKMFPVNIVLRNTHGKQFQVALIFYFIFWKFISATLWHKNFVVTFDDFTYIYFHIMRPMCAFQSLQHECLLEIVNKLS